MAYRLGFLLMSLTHPFHHLTCKNNFIQLLFRTLASNIYQNSFLSGFFNLLSMKNNNKKHLDY